MNSGGIDFYDPEIPNDVKKMARDQFTAALAEMVGATDLPWKSYYAKGCPEEPDAPEVEVRVCVPETEAEGPLPVLFIALGGGLALVDTASFGVIFRKMQAATGAILVAPIFRGLIDAPYPAAINDLHAAWIWVQEHAEEIGADPDNIVITGDSSGGHLALSLPFRLKRYGYAPKGAAVRAPITDDRLNKTSSRFWFSDFDGMGRSDWSGSQIHQYALAWMGGSEFASQFVGPEAFANHATVNDCKGLCPIYIGEYEFDPDRDNNLEFFQKCLEAGVFAEYHLYPGVSHATNVMEAIDEGVGQLTALYLRDIIEAINTFFKYDCRRPFTVDE